VSAFVENLSSHIRITNMTRVKKSQVVAAAIAAVVIAAILTGCSKDHLDPSQIGRFRPAPAVNIILDTLGVSEEAASAYEGVEDPTPMDVIAREQDYAFSSGDVIRIAIFELLQENQPYVDDFIVTESGNISIPEIGQLQAGGLTETQLEEEIRKSLSPGILKNPSVTVSLQNSMSRTFTIVGDGIANANRYPIPRYDFRLLDALAVAGSARQFNVSYIYVSRKVTGAEQAEEGLNAEAEMGLRPVDANGTGAPLGKGSDVNAADKDLLEVIEPAFTKAGRFGSVVTSAEMVDENELETLASPENVAPKQEPALKVSNEIPQPAQPQGGVEWVFKDGKWTPVKVDGGAVDEPLPQKPQQGQQTAKNGPSEKPLSKSSSWKDVQSGGTQTRVIRIPKDKLFGGDPRYNIVIKPQDTIAAQLDIVGEFYVLGNVNNQGIINLTGRPMTLKMAIAAAGGLGQLAWPKKCEVVRRTGEKREEIVMVDLEKISNGTQPDFFIKPNDVINVGTHGLSRYMYILRNAFRATYGFGFIYDRNFADRTLGFEHPLSPFFGY
jgi:polysaccharide biosynthesis/export protein